MTPLQLKESLDRAWVEFSAENELHTYLDGKAYNVMRDIFHSGCMAGMELLGGPALYVEPPQADHEELCRQAGLPNIKFAG